MSINAKTKKGGARPGAGRRAGIPNKANAAREARIAASGITPLDVMIETMRAHWEASLAEPDLVLARDLKGQASAIAKDAAPYVHPKLANVQHSGPNNGPIPLEMTQIANFNDAQLADLIAAIDSAIRKGGTGEGEEP